ncbi:MAG: helicase HerA domain-containing protein, partial [Thermoplasmata archaeon]
MIRLASTLSLPVDLVTESIAILARKRAGKSYTARRIIEGLYRTQQQIVIVDPKGDWWGIRSSKDGTGPGLPIVILGGEHGDIPLEVGGGDLVARLVAEDRVSILLDFSSFRKHEVATFSTAFLETLYRLKAKEANRTPMMLAIDEADAIAPQKGFHGEERMLGAAEDIVRRGGQRGIGVMLISQRAAVLNKNVLTQCGILILLQTTGSQDIDAVDEWIKKHGQPEQRAKVMETIAALPRGTAWFWAPGWPD